MVVASRVKGDQQLDGKLLIKDSIQNNSGTQLLEAADVHCSRVAIYKQEGTAADATEFIAMISGSSGTLKSVKAGCLTACVGDSTITVDIKQGNAGEASATVLSSVITLDSGDSNREAVSGTLSVTTLNSEDVIEVVIDATIGTGTLGIDPFVVLVFDENYPA
jgi:hypothetical protein